MCTLCHGLATRPDYGQGYRHDPEKARTYRQRWSAKHYRKHTSDDDGRQAYRNRKNIERERRRATAATSPAESPHPAREWAQAAGIPVKTAGRIPSHVLNAWEAAGAPEPPFTSPRKNSVNRRLTRKAAMQMPRQIPDTTDVL